MKKLVFVPLSDEMIYEHPELITGPIQAFSVAQPTRRTLAENNEKATIARTGNLRDASAPALGRARLDEVKYLRLAAVEGHELSKEKPRLSPRFFSFGSNQFRVSHVRAVLAEPQLAAALAWLRDQR